MLFYLRLVQFNEKFVMDKNRFYSNLWGDLTFFPTNDSFEKNCRRCLLNCKECFDECSQAPCLASQREDHKNGYFSIHKMPVPG